MTTVREVIKKGIERAKAERGDLWAGIFNNFFVYLPGGQERNVPWKEEDSLPRCSQWPENRRESIIRNWVENCDYSEKFWRGSKEQFYEDVDNALRETDCPINEIERLLLSWNFAKPLPESQPSFKGTVLRSMELAVPAYIKLREEGYSRQDLGGGEAPFLGR